jgi:hypothetical protein
MLSSSAAQAPDRKAAPASAKEDWVGIAGELGSLRARSAEQELTYGNALAHLGRTGEAQQAFERGRDLRPGEKRFPQELAGLAFQDKDYRQAARWLHLARAIDPADPYTTDFLATIYFLEGNLDAAIKNWNGGGKPQIENVVVQSGLRVRPELLNRAFALSPASELRLGELETSRVRVRGLDIFQNPRFELAARDDGKFDVAFRAPERNGFGRTKWAALAAMFRGVFLETVNPEYYNFHGSTVNFISLLRWDVDKRRAMASLSGPWRRNPKYRYELLVDLRNENWDLYSSLRGPVPLLGALNMRTERGAVTFASFESGRWAWATGAELSHRDFRSVVPGPGLPPESLLEGFELKQQTRINYLLGRDPERRWDVATQGGYELGRIWSEPGHTFVKLQASAVGHWFPQFRGDNYEMQERLYAGRTVGTVPFDELNMLGLERDNDLWIRAHIGTRDGRKGSAPLGRRYFLSNWEVDRNVLQKNVFRVKVGPFVDTGAIADAWPGLGSGKWLWDTGLQAKVRVLGAGFAVSYGRDLRSGNGTWYFTYERKAELGALLGRR